MKRIMRSLAVCAAAMGLLLTLLSSGAVAQQKMYWTDDGTDKIQRANLDGSGLENLVTGLSYPYGIALDVAGGKMYWTDAAAGKIQRANLEIPSGETASTRTDIEDLVTGVGSLGIALDVAGGKMYWTDIVLSVIQRANLDGTVPEYLVTELVGPRGIALDVAGEKMYWTDPWSFKIQRANLDGTGVEDLVTGLNPYGVALDVAGGKMYWTDFWGVKIQRANLDGTNVEDLVTTGLSHPAGIALDLEPIPISTGICPPGGGVTVVLETNDKLTAADVDETSLMLAGASPSRCTLTDADADGDDDLVCKFARRDLDLSGGKNETTLTGKTTGGTPFSGAESITIFNCR